MNRNDIFKLLESHPEEGLNSREITNSFLMPGEDPKKKFNSVRKLLLHLVKDGSLEKEGKKFTLSKVYLLKKIKDNQQVIEENYKSTPVVNKHNIFSLEHRINHPMGLLRLFLDDFLDHCNTVPPEILLCKSVYRNIVSLFFPVISNLNYATFTINSSLYIQLDYFYRPPRKVQ